ncbi:MAG TPA: HAD family hydrolase [Stellaceae bacterium]|nr:HAD family hydrolase [Stellaceae bacterium]
MAKERWITFDCFGTLVDWRTGYRQALEPIAGPRTAALVAAYHEAEPAIEAERPHRLYKDVLVTALERAARQVGLPLTAGESDVLVRKWGEMPFFADVGPALAALREAGWKLAMLTNCDDDLFARTLERFPLRPDFVVTAEMAGSYKPALGHFTRFAQETGVADADWIHAACSWFHDIEPARRRGIRRVWIDRDKTGHDPAAATRVLPDLAALPRTVAEIAAR